MEEELIKMASSQGIWSVITVFLIFYILKNQEKRDVKQDEREKNYQDIIKQLTEKFEILDDIKSNIEEIKSKLLK
jgi:hypothetical protein